MARTSNRLHLTLKGPGIAVDRDVPDNVAAELLRVVLQGEPTGPPPRTAAVLPRSSGVHGGGTLAELFHRHEPKRNPDKIAVIAYHLKAAGQASFTKEQVRAGFRRAGEREPGNFDRDWAWAVRNGWVDGDAAEGFYLTRTGERVVLGNFARDLVERTKLRHARKRRRTAKGRQ